MKNKKGFVLVETLVVTVFVMTVLTMLLVNYTPAISEFERREYSDDVDSKYDLFWVKKMVQSDIMLSDSTWTSISNRLYNSSSTVASPTKYTFWQLKAGDFESAYRNAFNELVSNTGIVIGDSGEYNGKPLIFITKYHLSKNVKNTQVYGRDDITVGGFFKDWLLDPTHYGQDFDPGLVEYVAHLPDYVNTSMNFAEYRLIAKFKRKIDPNLTSEDNNIYYTYATIEVMRS